MKEFGVPDPDSTAYDLLISTVQGKDVQYIMHYPRKPVNSKPCQLPGSLRVQAVLADNTVVTVLQPGKGKPAKVQK